MRKSAFIALATGAAMLLITLPASAHVSFSEPNVPKNSEEILEVHVPIEEEGHNATVTVGVPAEFGALYCYAEPGWSCATEAATADTPATFTWIRTSAAPTTEDFFSFGVQTPKAKGSYGFPITQEYSTGSVVEWNGPADSGHPAAYVTVK